MPATLLTPISALTSNKRRVSALKKLGIVSAGDALTYYPFRVTEPVPVRSVREASVGQSVAFAGVSRGARVIPMGRAAGFRLEAEVDDSSFALACNVQPSVVRLTFFSHKKPYMGWMSGRLRRGAHVVVAGTLDTFNNQLQFTHPEVLTVAPTLEESQSTGFGVDGEAGIAAGTGGGVVGLGVNSGGAEKVIGGVQIPGHHTLSNGLKYDAFSETEAFQRVCRPRPVYHANSRISSEHIHETILAVLEALDAAQGSDNGGAGGDPVSIPDILPQTEIAQRGLPHRAQAFAFVHNPQSVEQFHRGLMALRYEEAFVSQTAVLQERQSSRKADSFVCADTDLREGLIVSLPFDLTGGQRSVIDTIGEDMQRSWPMQRLLQGEVGSGKTIVALAAMLQAVGSGGQSVLVAPTRVLAEQHLHTIRTMVDQLNESVPVTLLTGGMKLAERRRALAHMASGEPGIVIATHAAFSKKVQMPNLALAVIDEQHRFGVEQRQVLKDMNTVDADGNPIEDGKTPHLLVMTATPIPRSAAMTWFGDLEISELTELPGGRKPITTVVVPEAESGTMLRMFWHLRHRIDAGERVYIVCPRIQTDEEAIAEAEGSSGQVAVAVHSEPSKRGARHGAKHNVNSYDEESEFVEFGTDPGPEDGNEPKPPLHAVSEMAARLSALPQFQGVSFATLTGGDDDETKQRVMADFQSGKTPVLVATTVIEVGVDVPQASCIVIFDADRFGLSQLHQLRGRVGRGGTKAWAFLISRAEPDSIAAQRLEAIRTSTDGARIAEVDLELRGAGDVTGDAQSGGRSGLKLLRVVKDKVLIADARARVNALLKTDPDLEGETELAGAVLDFTRGSETQILSS